MGKQAKPQKRNMTKDTAQWWKFARHARNTGFKPQQGDRRFWRIEFILCSIKHGTGGIPTSSRIVSYKWGPRLHRNI